MRKAVCNCQLCHIGFQDNLALRALELLEAFGYFKYICTVGALAALEYLWQIVDLQKAFDTVDHKILLATEFMEIQMIGSNPICLIAISMYL